MDAIEQFISEPTATNYADALTELASSEEYEPYGGHIERMEELLTNGEFKEALDVAFSAAVTLVLSPAAHDLARIAAEQLGDIEQAKYEEAMARMCLRSILETGKGSRQEPYLVSMVHDEYLIAFCLEFTAVKQTVAEDDGRWLDVLADKDGAELVFDITYAYSHLLRRLRK